MLNDDHTEYDLTHPSSCSRGNRWCSITLTLEDPTTKTRNEKANSQDVEKTRCKLVTSPIIIGEKSWVCTHDAHPHDRSVVESLAPDVTQVVR